jgi:two-component system, NtrC family, response regulator
MATILVIDDDPLVRASICEVVAQAGHTAVQASTLDEAGRRLQAQDFDVVFCDVRMPDGSGLSLLPVIRSARSSPEVIIITGFGEPDGAELAIKQGAWDYVEKPLSVQDLTLTVERALQYRDQKKAARPVALKREGILGEGPRISACFDLLAQAAATETNVLITGETGTGKELFALAIHRNSRRAERNFVVVDCAALPETLVESTLFGHLRGAFTGADKPRDGLVKQADGGTLFLDEVGELPLTIQKAFLRVLQERRFRPVGGGAEVSSDFRLIAATNRRLEDMVREGSFREDLLFRLRTIVLELPPLRDCREDIKDLAVHYVLRFCERYELPLKSISPEFFGALMAYDWPGNVRELIQALEKAIVSAREEPALIPRHLPEHIRVQLARTSVTRNRTEDGPARQIAAGPGPATLSSFRETELAKLEADYLTDLMKRTAGDIGEACRISGLSRSRLYALLKKYQVLGG